MGLCPECQRDGGQCIISSYLTSQMRDYNNLEKDRFKTSLGLTNTISKLMKFYSTCNSKEGRELYMKAMSLISSEW